MTIVDVDNHFEVADPIGPLGEWAHQVPSRPQLMTHFLAGDLLHDVSVDRRPSFEELLPDGIRAYLDLPADVNPTTSALGAHDAGDRLRWLDDVGIDVQLVVPGSYSELPQFLADPGERRRALRRCNDFLADALDGHTHRLMPVTCVDFDDVNLTVAELQRMRDRGSRAFFVRATPVAGRSPAHPHFDSIWAAASDLGMIALLHIGHTPARFDPGWADMGAERGGFLRFANSQHTQAAEIFLAALCFGGVFARHPNVTVLLAELWVGWLPFFVHRLDVMSTNTDNDLMLDRWPYELSAGDYLRRNVRATPLPGLGDDGMDTLRALGDMIVFSSDYPHREGSSDPVREYESRLAGVDDIGKARFLGGSMSDCFARTGDPLLV